MPRLSPLIADLTWIAIVRRVTFVEHDQVDAVVVGEGDERREPPVRGDDQGTRDEVLRHLALLGRGQAIGGVLHGWLRIE